ncbi:MAG: BatA domain-containing protein [candidate division WOR-3 bacterium]|nr:MAG: BatA domain-containing protein [candidate division WOR-3 bacterium]
MTFLNPLFLFGATLAVVPILIHLWFRKRLKRIPFSSLQFLKSTDARRFGWLRLREWLILLARCLFILFLFVSLARPHLKSALPGSGRLASVCLIVDNSYSMAYGDNFEKMKSLCRQVISHYSPNAEFCIMPLCEEGGEREVFWMKSKSVLHELEKIRIAYTGGSIRRALAGMSDKEAEHPIEYVYAGDGQAENFRDFPAEITRQSSFFWAPVSAGTNVGISHVVLKDPAAVPLQKYAIQVHVNSYSPRVWSGKLGVSSGEYYVEQECALQPGAAGSFDFDLPVEFSSGKVEIFDDSLLPDNAYYFRKQLPRIMQVLIIGDSPYVLNALRVESESTAPFEIQAADKIGNIDLRQQDVVILAGLKEISESERLRIVDYLSRPGTGLIVVLDDEVGDNLGKLLSAACRVREKVMPRGYVVVEWIDNSHRIFKIYEATGALKNVQFYSYLKVDAQGDVLARFSNGDPCFVIHANIAVITGRLLPQRTNFIYKNSFVPVLLRLLVNFAAESTRLEYYVGESVAPFNRVSTPAGDMLNSEDYFMMPGYHRVDGETLCVNVRPEEGNLQLLGAERMKILNVRQIDPERDLTGSDLSSFFLLLAMLMVLFELGLILLR